MRILALYDIHGNVDALEAVLADPRASGADAVVVGGDTVPGPFADAALARLDALAPPVHRIRGNGEREEGGPLARLPLTVVLDDVCFCHASPRRDDELLTPFSPPARWEQALAGVREPLVVGGHTHRQDDRSVGATRFVNAGSVGLPYEGDPAARWLWLEDGEPDLRRTTYDAETAGRRMLEAAGPLADSVRAALLEPADPDEIARMFEGR